MKRFQLLVFFALCFISMCVYAEGEAGPAPEASRDGGFSQTLVMIAIGLLLFYFIMYRPEQRRRKDLEEQRNNLKPGDKVMAIGILGEVAEVRDNTVILKMFDGSKIEMLKAAISEKIEPTTTPPPAKQ